MSNDKAVSDMPQSQSEANEEVMGSRQRHLTEKGHEYQISQRSSRLGSAKRSWKRVVQEILSGIDEVVSLSQLKLHKNEEQAKYDEVINAFEGLIEADPSSRVDLSGDLQIEEEVHLSCQMRIERKIQEVINETRSRSSRASHRSWLTDRSSFSAAKREELAAKMARLKVEQQFQEKELEHKRLIQEREREYQRMLLQKDMAATEAELHALTEDQKLDLPESDEENDKNYHLNKHFSSQELVPQDLVKSDLVATHSSACGIGEVQREVSKLEQTFLQVSPKLNPRAKSFKPVMQQSQAEVRHNNSSQSVDMNVLKKM